MSSSSKRPDTVLQKNFNVPVQTTDLSIFDDNYSAMKERFAAEMRRVDDEMNKFSSTLTRFYAQMIPTGIALTQTNTPTSQAVVPPPRQTSAQRPASQTQRPTSQTQRPASMTQQPAKLLQAPAPDLTTAPVNLITGWQNLISSPLVEGEGPTKTLKLQFDVSQFAPHEINVKIQDNVLMVSARHEERSDNTTVLREYQREFLLPKGIDMNTIKSSLSREGVLTFQAPLPLLPVTDESSNEDTKA